MRECAKKPLTVALAAVLVFMALFPVPVGARSLDRARFQEANANPAVAAPLIITTALAACGVYVAGYDLSAYANNQQTISGQFVEFCATNLYHDDIDAATAAIQSAVTPGGAVDMGVLSSLGVLGLVPSFAQYLSNNNEAVTGENSLAALDGAIYFNGSPWPAVSSPPQEFTKVAERWGVDWSQIAVYKVAESGTYKDFEFYTRFNGPSVLSGYVQGYGQGTQYKVSFNKITGSVSYMSSSASNQINSTNAILNKTWTWPESLNGCTITDGYIQRSIAVITQAIAEGNAVLPNSGVVEVFEPTAEQLAAGYDASAILEAINSNTGTIEGVAAQLGSIAGLLSPVAGIAANVQSIKDAWTSTMTAQATPFPWLNSLLSPITAGVQAVQSWIGPTPFPTIMQTVLDGVQAIPDGIRNLGDDLTGSLEGVLDGVLSIPGTLEGVLDGVLEGVQAIPLSIAQVIEAVQAGVVDLTGALDAAMHPQLPNIQFDGVSLALPTGLSDEVELNLRDKVPFCYVIRARDAIGNMAGNLGYVQTRGMMTSQSSSGGSFRFGIEIPYAGLVEFDGGTVLSQPFGMYDIGTTIRILVTALLCFGLLMRAWKTAERTFGGM